jgi:PKD repeat protein
MTFSTIPLDALAAPPMGNTGVEGVSIMPPIAEAGPDQTVQPGESFSVSAEGSHDPDGFIVEYRWDFGDGTTKFGTPVSHSYDIEGVYEVKLTVTDNDGVTAQDTLMVHVENEPPVVSAGMDVEVYEDEVVYFDGSATTDDSFLLPSPPTKLEYYWSFGDGTTGTGVTPQHVYSNEGLYNVELRVTDNVGCTRNDFMTVYVKNKPPEAIASIYPAESYADVSSWSVEEDEYILFDASLSSDTVSDQRTLQYLWDFGDNSKSSEIRPTHRYTSAGTYTVKLTVTDNNGAVATDLITVKVENVDPIAIINGEVTRITTFSGGESEAVFDFPWLEGGEQIVYVDIPSDMLVRSAKVEVSGLPMDETLELPVDKNKGDVLVKAKVEKQINGEGNLIVVSSEPEETNGAYSINFTGDGFLDISSDTFGSFFGNGEAEITGSPSITLPNDDIKNLEFKSDSAEVSTTVVNIGNEIILGDHVAEIAEDASNSGTFNLEHSGIAAITFQYRSRPSDIGAPSIEEPLPPIGTISIVDKVEDIRPQWV